MEALAAGHKVWLIVDSQGRAHSLPSGVVFYSWSLAKQALREARQAGVILSRGLRVQVFVTPKVSHRHERPLHD